MFKAANTTLQKKRLFACSILSIAVVFVMFSIYVIKANHSRFTQKTLDTSVLGASEQDNKDLIEEKVFWENFLVKNPQYFTGYVRLVEIEKSLGNYTQAETYYKKAFDINPNSEELKSTN